MDYNKVFIFDAEKFQIKDSEYRKVIEKSLGKLSEELINDTFLGYESTIPQVEKFVHLLAQHKIDYTRYYKENHDKLISVKNGFYCNENGFTTELEFEIFTLIKKADNLLEINDYTENHKSKTIFEEIKSKFEEFVMETNLIDKRTRLKFQEKVSLIRELMEMNTFVSMLVAISELKKIDKIKKENSIYFQNLYLRNINRYEIIKDEFTRVKTYFTINEKKVIDLQLNDVEKLLNSESYDKFDNASDILDKIEEKFKLAISGKKDRIIKYLRTEVDALKGYVWKEDLKIIRDGSELIISEAQKSNDFNNLNLDKYKKDERVNLKKQRIYRFIKDLVDSSSNTRNEQHKGKLSNLIKQAETFYKSDVSLKEFEEFTKNSKNLLGVRTSRSKAKYSALYKWLILAITLMISIFVILNNASKAEQYTSEKGKKYLDYISNMVKTSIKAGASLDKDKFRKRLFVPKDDLQIIILSDSSVTINYKGNILKADF